MRAIATCCLLALAAAARGQAPPDSAEQAKIIAEIGDVARAYIKNLPDFICTQLTRREILAASDARLGVKESGSRGGAGSFAAGPPRQGDAFEEQLTYFDHHENYKLLKVNGKPARAGATRPPGLTSTGEFATTLDAIFDPASQTQFEWKRWETLRGRTVHVFSFRVEQSRSMAELSVPGLRVIVGYHGLIYADRDTKMALRVTTESESPKDFPLQDVTHLLDYGPVTISGRQFTLPLHAEMQTRMSEDFFRSGKAGGNSRQVFMRNEVDFREYRKYTASAELVDSEKR